MTEQTAKEMGRKGGLAVKAKNPPDHFKQLAKKRWHPETNLKEERAPR